MNQNTFEEIWERIKEETDLNKFLDLAEFLDVSKSNISNRKNGNNFPVEWAYRIARKYRLHTEWIMTGEGLAHIDQSAGFDLEFFQKAQQWIKEEERKQPGAINWLEFDFRKKYPEFDKWEKRGKGDSDEHIPEDKRHIA